jgi:hypothetical protein
MQSEGPMSDLTNTQRLWSSDNTSMELKLPDSSDTESEVSPCMRIDYMNPHGADSSR